MTIDYSGWTLTFSDEFSGQGPTPNPKVWACELMWGGNAAGVGDGFGSAAHTLAGNDEAEWYCDPNQPAASGGTEGMINPFTFTGSSMIITAQPSTNLTATSQKPFQSGEIASWPSFSQAFGIFEQRVRFPGGVPDGAWPAGWMLPGGPNTNAPGAPVVQPYWPPEIDIYELPQNSAQKIGGPNQLHTGLVGGAGANTGGVDAQWNTTAANPLDGAFHTFTFQWDSLSMVWYLDGVVVNRVRTPKQFIVPVYVIANLAIGGAGSWPGAAPAATVAKMEIDYIRVFSMAPDAVPVAWQGASSPDGVDTTPIGAISSTGPILVGTGTITLKVASHIAPSTQFLGPATFVVQVDGQPVGGTQTATANFDSGNWAEVTINAPIFGAKTITVALTDSFFSPPFVRSLAIDSVSYADTAHGYSGTLTSANLASPLGAGDTLEADGVMMIGNNQAPAIFALPAI